MKLYMGNLSYDLTEEELQQAVETYGQVDSVAIIKDKYSGRSKGFGFVEMASNDEANSAIEGLNGTDLKGRTLNVNEARPRENRNRGGYGGGGNRGGYGGGGNRGGYGGGGYNGGGNRGGYNGGGNRSY